MKPSEILRKCIKILLRYILYAIIAFVIGLYVHVLLCVVLGLQWGI
jgi:hypothetical protein